MIKDFLISLIVLIVGFYFVVPYIFNHFNPFLGIASIIGVIYLIYLIFKKHIKSWL
jgi:uncharacterized membrane protein